MRSNCCQLLPVQWRMQLMLLGTLWGYKVFNKWTVPMSSSSMKWQSWRVVWSSVRRIMTSNMPLFIKSEIWPQSCPTMDDSSLWLKWWWWEVKPVRSWGILCVTANAQSILGPRGFSLWEPARCQVMVRGIQVTWVHLMCQSRPVCSSLMRWQIKAIMKRWSMSTLVTVIAKNSMVTPAKKSR